MSSYSRIRSRGQKSPNPTGPLLLLLGLGAAGAVCVGVVIFAVSSSNTREAGPNRQSNRSIQTSPTNVSPGIVTQGPTSPKSPPPIDREKFKAVRRALASIGAKTEGILGPEEAILEGSWWRMFRELTPAEQYVLKQEQGRRMDRALDKTLGRAFGGRGPGMGSIPLPSFRPSELPNYRKELGSSDVAALNREVGIYAKLQWLDSPHLLKIREVDRDDRYFFIVTDYAEGGDLASYVAERQHVNWTVEEARTIALQIADGLRELHSRSIVHRDIKPENVLLAGGHWKLADFGISKNLERISTIKTQGGKGSLGYAPPEQWKLGTAASPSADVYSFGKIVVFLLTGETDVDAVIDPDWQELIRSCTRQLPGDRPPIVKVLEMLSAIPT